MAQHSKRISNSKQTKEKKRKLRTFEDIYHRLKHDNTLNIDLDNVVIGYKDGKYDEIQEVIFNDFTLIENGGKIPMHHVEYYKLNDDMLWNREQRLDRLFGSGSTKPHQLLNKSDDNI